MHCIFAHPSPDLYGSDLQLLESVCAVIERGGRATVFLPKSGPLVDRIEQCGGSVYVLDFPVLRLAILKPLAFLVFVGSFAFAIFRICRVARKLKADVLYVNTITLPVWTLCGVLIRLPTVVHVHEAEERGPRLLRKLLVSQLLLSELVIVNSGYAAGLIESLWPSLGRRSRVVYNGIRERRSRVPGLCPEESDGLRRPLRLAYVGRLSPRKGVDVLLTAVNLLSRRGFDIRLIVAGDVFEGYEWYAKDLAARARELPPNCAVDFVGYAVDPSEILVAADLAIVPSRFEPFGNTAVEAQLAGVPVVAASVQGLREIVEHRETGFLFESDDSGGLADAISELFESRLLSSRIAAAALYSSRKRFGVEEYRRNIADVVFSFSRRL